MLSVSFSKEMWILIFCVVTKVSEDLITLNDITIQKTFSPPSEPQILFSKEISLHCSLPTPQYFIVSKGKCRLDILLFINFNSIFTC
jgi:hypothetical protein